MISKTIQSKLISIVGAENVEDSHATRLAYSYDATPRFQSLPDCVVSPKSTEEVAAVVKLCNQERIPIVPRGSGTNLCAGTTPLKGGIVILFKHMNKILEIDQNNLTVTTQPGVTTKELSDAVEDVGLFYPPDPGSMHISQIGGNIGENSGGLRGLKYGVTRDYVLGLEIVLPNGKIIRTGGKLAKDVAGYDLTSLFVGSEGTLGIITEAILKLLPQPETKQTMLALYHNIEAAAETVSAIIANRKIPATLEFLDKATTKVVEDYSKIGLPTEAEAILLIEQDGTPDVVKQDLEKIAVLCKENGAFEVSVAKTKAEGERLMTARRASLTALSRLRPTTILEDATVPRSNIAKMVTAIQDIARKYQLTIRSEEHTSELQSRGHLVCRLL